MLIYCPVSASFGRSELFLLTEIMDLNLSRVKHGVQYILQLIWMNVSSTQKICFSDTAVVSLDRAVPYVLRRSKRESSEWSCIQLGFIQLPNLSIGSYASLNLDK